MEDPTPLNVDMRGIVYASAEVRTVGDLRALIDWCNTYGVRDAASLDWGTGVVHIDIIENAHAEWVSDGDSPDERFDVVVSTS
jgi:hypothetical protein